MTASDREAAELLASLGIVVLERGWLSSNNILFLPRTGYPATVVDTGYALHAEQTEQLLRSRLGPRRLARIVNTHLHSDHCGGNARLQATFGCEVWVPAASLDVVTRWDLSRLSFEQTDQRCDRFTAHRGVEPGSSIALGETEWLALGASGHDPDAVMFFQPDSRVLIAGDALWEDRLAIIFPELIGAQGFENTRRTLGLIESLRPRLVVPGHGPPFVDVESALASSRHRLNAFEQMPERHLAYALRALAMFHMLEQRRRPHRELADWMARTPILRQGMLAAGLEEHRIPALVEETISRLVRDGVLVQRQEDLVAVGDRRG